MSRRRPSNALAALAALGLPAEAETGTRTRPPRSYEVRKPMPAKIAGEIIHAAMAKRTRKALTRLVNMTKQIAGQQKAREVREWEREARVFLRNTEGIEEAEPFSYGDDEQDL